MRNAMQFYIGGRWIAPTEAASIEVINPATEQPAGRVSMGSPADVDKAVAAAREAFDSYSQTSREERIALLERISGEYQKRYADIAAAITEEMGAPAALSNQAQAAVGIAHLQAAIGVLKQFPFEEPRGTTLIRKEPIGVCGLITPWNWPVNQVVTKVFPALAVGCTMVLKPSEVAPFSAIILAEVLDAAGVPAGVFNLVNGEGPIVGAAIASHPDVDMVSFTGSTRGGIAVAKAAADTVKRVHQELGGKSPNIILDDADLAQAVTGAMRGLLMNSGQSCNAPTRLLVPHDRMDEVKAISKAVAEATKVGDPNGDAHIGPVASEAQWKKVQSLIEKGLSEGATLVAGGPGRPEGLERGFYVKPTVFADVTNDMVIAREEIFGPVAVILGYSDDDEAVRIANDTPYGLAAYVQSADLERASRIASRLRAGQVTINGAGLDFMAPFGGYKQSAMAANGAITPLANSWR
jgi:aldehyde dehydrogenase (NAD+)